MGSKIIGLILILFGIFCLSFEYITISKQEKVMEIGPITASKETDKTIPLPPILGALSIVGGVILLVWRDKK